MHSSKGNACARTSPQQPLHANHFPFPPTQRFGLLGSATPRSSNQRLNLKHSYANLLDALNVPTLQHATA